MFGKIWLESVKEWRVLVHQSQDCVLVLGTEIRNHEKNGKHLQIAMTFI